MAPWTKQLLSDSRLVVGALLKEPLMDVGILRSQVAGYRDQVRGLGDASVVDVPLVEALSAGMLELLADTVDDDGARKLAQVAARYFVLSDDGDGDLSSPFGFDDDVEVFNAVVQTLGQEHRRIPY
ncbi:MAG: hypothetical protein KTR31_16425 [Myxococcales bacterium]|nr:hypothetical protein [Myxococcales bacterium]